MCLFCQCLHKQVNYAMTGIFKASITIKHHKKPHHDRVVKMLHMYMKIGQLGCNLVV